MSHNLHQGIASGSSKFSSSIATLLFCSILSGNFHMITIEFFQKGIAVHGLKRLILEYMTDYMGSVLSV